MRDPLQFDIIAVFPNILDSYWSESIMKRAIESHAVNIRMINLRDFTEDNHRTVDDRSYGGGPGMVMMPEPIFKAVESVKRSDSRIILVSPQGRPFKQSKALELSREKHVIFISGHYEGIDERVRDGLVDDDISIGDYVLTNGMLPTAVIIDSVVRLIPGVLGGENATEQESFSDGLLEYPQYTRPSDFQGMKVPDVLLSGDHQKIADWRDEQSRSRTKEKRPDLLRDK